MVHEIVKPLLLRKGVALIVHQRYGHVAFGAHHNGEQVVRVFAYEVVVEFIHFLELLLVVCTESEAVHIASLSHGLVVEFGRGTVVVEHDFVLQRAFHLHVASPVGIIGFKLEEWLFVVDGNFDKPPRGVADEVESRLKVLVFLKDKLSFFVDVCSVEHVGALVVVVSQTKHGVGCVVDFYGDLVFRLFCVACAAQTKDYEEQKKTFHIELRVKKSRITVHSSQFTVHSSQITVHYYNVRMGLLLLVFDFSCRMLFYEVVLWFI